MADTDTTSPTRGGSIAYSTGKEVLVNASVSDPAQLAITDMGKVRKIYSTRRSAVVVTLPSALGALASATTKQKQVGIMVNPNSPVVAIKNGGTAGTDAILEKVLSGGAMGSISCYDVTTAPGVWAYHGDGALPGYPWQVSVGTPVTKSIGVTTLGTNQQIGAFANALLSSTMGAVAIADSTNNINLYAYSLNADGTPNSISNLTQLRSGAVNTMQNPSLLKLSSTKVIASWWDNTNAKNEYVAVTIAAGNPPTIGTPGSVIDDSAKISSSTDRLKTSNHRMVSDATDQLFDTGIMVTQAGCRAYHMTLTGTAITFDTSTIWNTFAQTSFGSFGYSPATNKLLVASMLSGAAFQLDYLSYSAGSISVSWTKAYTANSSGASVPIWIDALDLTNNWYCWPHAQGAHAVKLDLSNGDIQDQFSIGLTPEMFTTTSMATYWGTTDIPGFINLGDGEALNFYDQTGTGANQGFTMYLDMKAQLRHGPGSLVAGSVGGNAFATLREYPVSAGGSVAGGVINRPAFDPTTRLLSVVNFPRVKSGNLSFAVRTFLIPKR